MKARILPISIGLGVIVVGLVLWLLFSGSFKGDSIVQEVSAEPIGDVSTLSPHLELKKAGAPQPLVVSETQSEKVAPGDNIQTGENGRGIVSLENGAVTVINYNTTFVVEDEEGSSHLELENGYLWGRVQKLVGKGEYYEIETENAVAVVRGTSFGVGHKDGISTLLVSEGVVGFIPKDPITKERLTAKEVKVEAGFKATIGKDGVIVKTPLVKADKNEWFLFNNPEKKTETPVPPKETTPNPPQEDPTPNEPVTQAPPAFALTSITPTKVTANIEIPPTITLKGVGFARMTAVVIGKNTIPSGDVTVVNDTSIRVSLRNFQSSAVYDVTVVSIDNRVSTLPLALTIEPAPVREEPPPQTYYPSGQY